jgi:hypothetical protein
MSDSRITEQSGNDFENAARQAPATLLGEFWAFLRQNKKWWLLPILLVLLVLGILVVLSTTPLAPFIYTLY